MVQGATSSAGKSTLCAGLCRVFRREGFNVAPFKSQNMSTRAVVIEIEEEGRGGEISAAQAFQALAAGVRPSVDMNPVLLKPLGDMTSEVILAGRSVGVTGAREYRDKYVKTALEQIQKSLGRLVDAYDIVVIEGAGSPAEVNLKDRDICNMRIAKMANAPVILVGNIDPGGVLAAIVGTLDLLEPDERDRVRGLVINKFRGDFSLLQPGLEFLEERTGKPILGVLPYVHDLKMIEEDSLGGNGGGSFSDVSGLDKTCDRLADVVSESVDVAELMRIMGM
ncbi:MAG: cobyric acid synthase [Clostridia bacterium]|nr:cobyric acid synthase [Clostridia bacterium]